MFKDVHKHSLSLLKVNNLWFSGLTIKQEMKIINLLYINRVSKHFTTNEEKVKKALVELRNLMISLT